MTVKIRILREYNGLINGEMMTLAVGDETSMLASDAEPLIASGIAALLNFRALKIVHKQTGEIKAVK